MKYIKLTAIIVLSVMFTGCWDYRELNDMAIVIMIGVDKEDDNFIVTTQIINANKGGSSSGSSSAISEVPVVVYSAEGKTVHEALKNALVTLPKEEYLGHLAVLVFGEKLVMNNDVTDYIDFFDRFSESRKAYKLLVVKDGKASDFLKILTPLIEIPGVYVHDLIETNNTVQGTLGFTTLEDFNINLYLTGNEPTITALKIVGDPEDGSSKDSIESLTPKTRIEIAGITVFKNKKAVGYLNLDESIGYSFLKNNFKAGSIAFPCDEKNYGTITITSSKTGSKITIEDNQPYVSINVNVKSYLSELHCKLDVRKTKDLEKIEKSTEEVIKKYMTDTLNSVLKKYNSDILGFGLNLYRNNYAYWQKNKDNWDSIFEKIKYDIKVKVLVDQTGSVLNTETGEN
jgi:spore germination protein KC